MTFKEELTNISDKVGFELRIAEHCAAMQEAMKESAKSGCRTYQVEVIKPFCNYAHSELPDNYYIIFCDKDRVINDYVMKVVEWAKQLGFHNNDISTANMRNNYYCSTQITIKW
jgi:hypothetical protein